MNSNHTAPRRIDTDPALKAEVLKAAAALGTLGGGGQGAPRILALLCDPAAGAPEIAAMIDREPGMSARVLRVANSAFYGKARNVGTVERALVLLGLDAVRGIAAAACLDRSVRRSGEAPPVDMDQLVRHSLATGTAAEALAKLRHAPIAPEAFIAGLLHNLGVAVQLRVDPAGMQRLVETLAARPDADLRAAEAACVRVGHEDCAATMFEAWQLPATLVQAAQHHHAPLAAPESCRELAGLVHLGIHVALAAGHTYALERAPPPRDVAVMALLGVTDAELDTVTEGLSERLSLLQQALQAA